MNVMYLVTYFRHNKTTGGNAYKTELATESLDEAKKKYHTLLGEYINSDTFDFASIVITDNFGNRIEGEYWEEEKPQPEPTPEVNN